MKKYLISLFLISLFLISLFGSHYSYAVEDLTGSINKNNDIIIPDEIDWTDRFILSEIKELRVNHESLKRELNKTIQEMELSIVDRALSYSGNTVNFFFVLLTVLVSVFGILGWKTFSDIKNGIRHSIDKETLKIIEGFQEKINSLEKEQKVNILWRQYNSAETDQEKISILDKISKLRPFSQTVLIEQSNVYISMGLYKEAIEITTKIIQSNRIKHQTSAFFNRLLANNYLKKYDDAISDLCKLINLSPDYKEYILNTESLNNLFKYKKVKDIFQEIKPDTRSTIKK